MSFTELISLEEPNLYFVLQNWGKNWSISDTSWCFT